MIELLSNSEEDRLITGVPSDTEIVSHLANRTKIHTPNNKLISVTSNFKSCVQVRSLLIAIGSTS